MCRELRVVKVMKAYHFDAKTGEEMRPTDVSGVTGFTSWRRLGEIFRDAGELRADEELLSFQVDSRGICYRVRTKND